MVLYELKAKVIFPIPAIYARRKEDILEVVRKIAEENLVFVPEGLEKGDPITLEEISEVSHTTLKFDYGGKWDFSRPPARILVTDEITLEIPHISLGYFVERQQSSRKSAEKPIFGPLYSILAGTTPASVHYLLPEDIFDAIVNHVIPAEELG